MPKTKGGKRRELERKGEAEARANETGGLEIAGGHTFKGRKTTHMCVRLRNQEVGLGLLGGSVTLSTGFFLSNGKTGKWEGRHDRRWIRREGNQAHTTVFNCPENVLILWFGSLVSGC